MKKPPTRLFGHFRLAGTEGDGEHHQTVDRFGGERREYAVVVSGRSHFQRQDANAEVTRVRCDNSAPLSLNERTTFLTE
jgi:hypothetical protein